MKPVVLIPCYKRPEFLYHTLRRIEKAKHADKMFYLFAVDGGADPGNDLIIQDFKFEKKIIRRGYKIAGIGKQSYNVLEGYREACNISDSFVFNIEDDIMIATNFFEWHLLTHQKYANKIFCSIGTRNNNSKFDVTDDLSKDYIGAPTDYQSLGVCFNKYVLTELILPHATDTYYRSPVSYCSGRFPKSKIGKYFCEQDGLIRRIKEESDLLTIFPHVPRAYHAGFYSYNRNLKSYFKGSLKAKIKMVETVLENPVLYRQHCGEHYNDSIPCQLDYAD